MNEHEYLRHLANEAINRLFSDRSVTPDVTAESLGELRDSIDMMLDSLEV